jgi:hypothetical protein
MQHHVIDNSICGIPEHKKAFYGVLNTIPKNRRKTAIELGAYCGSTSTILCNFFNKLTIIEDYSISAGQEHLNTNSYNIIYKNNSYEIYYSDILDKEKHLTVYNTLKYNLKTFNNYIIHEESFEKFIPIEKYDFCYDDTFNTPIQLTPNFIIQNKKRFTKAFELVNDGGLYCLGGAHWFIKNISTDRFILELLRNINKGVGKNPYNLFKK